MTLYIDLCLIEYYFWASVALLRFYGLHIAALKIFLGGMKSGRACGHRESEALAIQLVV